MRKLMNVHPILIGICPVLFLFAHNMSELSIRDLPAPLIAALLLSIIVWATVKIFVRDGMRASLIASLIMVMFFTYGHLYELSGSVRALVPGWIAIFSLLWLVALALLIRLLARTTRPLNGVTEGVFFATAVFFFGLLVSIGHTEWSRITRIDQIDHLYAAQAAPKQIPPEQLPDIYYIILDSYASNATLNKFYGYDNKAFLDHLSSKGFYVLTNSHSNYCQTILSLPSSLNFDYLNHLIPVMGERSNDREPLEALIRNCRVVRLLRQYGYKIVALPSEYEPVAIPSDLNVDYFGGYSDFNDIVMHTTPLLILSLTESFNPREQHRQRIIWQLDHLPMAAQFPGPKFVFAHILAPHPPIVMDANGNPLHVELPSMQQDRHWRTMQERREDFAHKYNEEVKYLNTRTTAFVDHLLATSKRPLAIIIQADHGPGYLPDGKERLEKRFYPEKFGILNAIYLSGGAPRGLYPSMSPVNTFRVLFNHIFKTQYPLLPDERYYSTFDQPYRFERVKDIMR